MNGRHDRAALVFGDHAQRTLDSRRVAVVGVGGLGAEVATMLRRISDAHLVLIDPDRIEASNLPRLPGTQPNDVGRPKAEVLGSLLDRGDGARAVPHTSMVEDIDDRDLFDADIIVVTADGAAPRADVTIRARRQDYQGVLVLAAARIDPPAQLGAGPRLLGRVTVQGPRSPWCVFCAGVVDPNDAARELDVSPEAQTAAGYGPEAAVAAVAWWNSVIAGRTVQLIHEHAAGLRPVLATEGLDWYLDGNDLLVVSNGQDAVPSCQLCSTPPGQRGALEGLPPLTPWKATT